MECNFDAIDPMPPIKYPNNMFDVIYLYSVFSHLSEAAHQSWLNEFHRILKPGGIFIATTRPIEFIEYCQVLARKKQVNEWERGSTLAFTDPDQAIIDYKNGKFIFSPTGGGGVLDKSFFGESCISERYAKNNWNKFFKAIEYIPASSHKQFDQTVIVGIK
jgi:SAM-dependent methyltransferase